MRKLVKEGKLDEARQMCDEQTHAALGHLQGDPAWRHEYLDLWMHQRPPPYRITFDDYDFDGEHHLQVRTWHIKQAQTDIQLVLL